MNQTNNRLNKEIDEMVREESSKFFKKGGIMEINVHQKIYIKGQIENLKMEIEKAQNKTGAGSFIMDCEEKIRKLEQKLEVKG